MTIGTGFAKDGDREFKNMNKQISFLHFKSFVLVIFCFLAFSNAFAATTSATDQIAYSLVAENLSTKLKADLSQSNVSVKISNVKRRDISKNEMELGGDGFAVLINENNQLPIRFSATVNIAQKSVLDVRYDFVEANALASEYAPTSNEEFLMKELMKQISADYKTANIVIALDGVENNAVFTGKKEFTGIGEVRIGDLEWNKIKFAVEVDTNGKAIKVAYDVKK